MAWQHMHSLTCLDGWMIGAGIGMCAYKASIQPAYLRANVSVGPHFKSNLST